EFLLDAPPPPAPFVPAAVCVVDTGVDLNPDTSGAVVARYAYDGGVVDDVGSADGFPHGTNVASIIAAPRNGWGLVGIWPQARIGSVRVFAPDGAATPDGYATGVYQCLREAATFSIKVINLSLSDLPSTTTTRDLNDVFEAAARADITVVVSAGNRPGPVMYPASLPGVLA